MEPNRQQSGRRQAMIWVGIVILLLVAALPLIMKSSEGEMTQKTNQATDNRAGQANVHEASYKSLTPEEERVIIHKGTERPFTGKYYNHKEAGTYVCKQCGAALYRSTDKFDSGCGWPSFDDEIPGAVTRTMDADGRRTEITCTNCGGHLGHVFLGEGFTDKDTRHCVNSISLDFVPAGEEAEPKATMMSAKGDDTTVKRAYFAGGCFWGVEHLLQQQDGVKSVVSGYMGGHTKNPTYKEVCSGTTGHAETVEVVFDPTKVDFETLAKLFFEIHDPTQMNRQGPDRGNQYRSAVFFVDEKQKTTTEKLIGLLKNKGYEVVTQVAQAGEFYPAEDYHQDYYEHKGTEPYCHFYTERF